MNHLPERTATIFVEALRRPLGARPAYLDDTCAGDEALRDEVDRLLAAHAHQASPHENRSAPNSGPVTIGEKPGDYLSAYRLLQQIGEGGCGVVYMAEQVTRCVGGWR